MISLFNTLSRQKEELTSEGDTLRVYTCGPTVYLDPQIGNWRMFIFYDTLVRTLHAHNYKTKHVMNITDVGHLVSDEDEGEDKLAKQAAKERKTAWEIADYYTKRYLDGRASLNMLQLDVMPKATDTIPEQIAMIKAIEEKGATYRISDGIYFDTTKFPGYGKMARLSLDGQEAGSRVEVNPEKRNPQDFALWKFSPKDQKRDMEWDSPWGIGFPGWHIECSAMAKAFLSDTIDIHAGGIDHIPVHHTNEIAQSETANGVQFSRFWVHGAFMMVDGAKLSKSLGNSYTIDDIIAEGYNPLSFRLLVLQSHYRSESNFTWDGLDVAEKRLLSLRQLAEKRWQTIEGEDQSHVIEGIKQKIMDALSDDINTPRIFEAISELETVLQSGVTLASKDMFESALDLIDSVFGLRLLEHTPNITSEQKALITQRDNAKSNKDYTISDSIRDVLDAQGIELLDGTNKTTWRRNKLI